MRPADMSGSRTGSLSDCTPVAGRKLKRPKRSNRALRPARIIEWTLGRPADPRQAVSASTLRAEPDRGIRTPQAKTNEDRIH